MEKIAIEANKAKNILAKMNEADKNNLLLKIADEVDKNKELIYEANKKDLELAQTLVEENKISKSTYNRLKLDENKMRDMIQGIKDVAKLEDLIGKTLLKRELDDGLILEKIVCPIGVIGVIFEARPDVITQISALAIKTGNAVILKGGTESNNTNKAIFDIIEKIVPKNSINLVFSRDDIKELLKQDKYIDLIIPRGSNKLVKYIQENTKIPVLGHASGICNIYVDEHADIKKAEKICVDAKTQYPSACNSVENILIHKNFKYIEELKDALIKADVEIVQKEEFETEFGDKIVNIKIVESLNEAMDIIANYGSGHTDCIITEDKNMALEFINTIDSAGVYHNCSTRFADGFRYGFGAEVGISTNKTHSRGPVGLEGLTIYKYVLSGDGHIVDDYSKGIKTFTHKNLL